jgi:hypothetical protein
MAALTTIRKSRYAVEPGNDIHTFTVGATYFGGLICSHGQHKLVCVKRTSKSVWFSVVDAPYINGNGEIQSGEAWRFPRRSKIQWHEYKGQQQETTVADGWMVDADGRDYSDEPGTY